MNDTKHCPDCGDVLLAGDETTCKGEPLKTYYVTTVIKTLDVSLGTIDGTANYLTYWNSFRAEGSPDNAGDVAANLQDCGWVYLKVANLF